MPRTLVVEDEVFVALHLCQTLEELGHDVAGYAPDTDEALRLADKGVDLAFVDINLRDGVTGPQIAREIIRRHGAAVLFVTANPGLAPKMEGVVGVLNKPVDEDELAQAAAYALAVREGVYASPPPALYVFSDDGSDGPRAR